MAKKKKDKEEEFLPEDILRSLGLAPQEQQETKIEIVMPESPADDYSQVRKNLYEILGKGMHVLDIAIQTVRDSQHPRATEVATGLMNSLADINFKIDKMTQDHTKKDMKEVKSGTLYLTSEELLDSIKKEDKDDGV